VRNTGASIGISFVIALLGQGTQANRAEMAAQVSTLNPLYQAPLLPPSWSLGDPAGLAAIDAEIVRQATMIAYLNDFVLLTYTPLIAIPLLFFFRSDRRAAPA
jgi:DHA2 family multidrug resistance protein